MRFDCPDDTCNEHIIIISVSRIASRLKASLQNRSASARGTRYLSRVCVFFSWLFSRRGRERTAADVCTYLRARESRQEQTQHEKQTQTRKRKKESTAWLHQLCRGWRTCLRWCTQSVMAPVDCTYAWHFHLKDNSSVTAVHNCQIICFRTALLLVRVQSKARPC
jgi:hypothetical protein